NGSAEPRGREWPRRESNTRPPGRLPGALPDNRSTPARSRDGAIAHRGRVVEAGRRPGKAGRRLPPPSLLPAGGDNRSRPARGETSEDVSLRSCWHDPEVLYQLSYRSRALGLLLRAGLEPASSRLAVDNRAVSARSGGRTLC